MSAPCRYEYTDACLTEKAVSAPTFLRRPAEGALLTEQPAQKIDVPLARRTMTIQFVGEKPAWLDTTAQTMRRLSRLPANWSSYGSSHIEDAAIISAASFLIIVLGPRGLAPTVVPTLQGGVQLEWHRNGVDIEIEFSPQGALADAYVYERQTDTTWEPEHIAWDAYQRLRSSINRLGQR